VEKAPINGHLRVWLEGENINGDAVKRGVLLDLGAVGPARQRLEQFGFRALPSGEQMDIIFVKFGSKAEKAGVEQGYKITSLEVETDNPKKEWMFLPALGLLALIAFMQRRRLLPQIA
jgi:hypothetical protein